MQKEQEGGLCPSNLGRTSKHSILLWSPSENRFKRSTMGQWSFGRGSILELDRATIDFLQKILKVSAGYQSRRDLVPW
jgi:hypothetical protein